MNASFEGKVALVAGAASGIGLATAGAFAEAGAAVAMADFDEDKVRSAADALAAAAHALRRVRYAKHQLERRAPAGRVLHPNAAAEFVHHFFHDRKTEPRSGRLRSTLAPKGFEDFYTIVRRHAFAMISDVNSAARVNAHEDRSAFRFGAERVVDQIGENALDPATVATRHDRF